MIISKKTFSLRQNSKTNNTFSSLLQFLLHFCPSINCCACLVLLAGVCPSVRPQPPWEESGALGVITMIMAVLCARRRRMSSRIPFSSWRDRTSVLLTKLTQPSPRVALNALLSPVFLKKPAVANPFPVSYAFFSVAWRWNEWEADSRRVCAYSRKKRK